MAVKADPDDDKFVDCAFAANAHCIITNDRHFKVLRKRTFPQITVFKPEAFQQLITSPVRT
ncbi:hypothetical protein LC612_41225 [Nostoc sp. CHAB 5834]|nr:hypothetical protein [Nostoc sp. CHAB 5834]